jgi:hypothetical protein
MILVGNQRGGAKDLALHLMKDDNERVVVDEVRGFASDDLASAFQESYAMSRGTRCKQHLYSLSLNPPKEESVDRDVFRDAVDRAEQRLGLQGQPRAIVFHEKRGRDGEVRRHAHAVWCRIDTENMKAVQLSFTKRKLQDLGRELYLEHGWQMPRGFVRSQKSNPRNYSLAEWQQAKRAGKDPEKLKAMFQDCWAISDSQATFSHALRERGYILARGDRRGFVAVDHNGEAYAISRWTGFKAKQVRARMNAPDALPDTGTAHREASKIVTDRLRELQAEQKRKEQAALARLTAEKQRKEAQQRAEAERLRRQQLERAKAEEQERQARIRKGFFGLLDRVTGKRKRIETENQTSREMAKERDRQENGVLVTRHRHVQAELTAKAERTRHQARETAQELTGDIQRLKPLPRPEPVKAKRRPTSERPRRQRGRDGPTLER